MANYAQPSPPVHRQQVRRAARKAAKLSAAQMQQEAARARLTKVREDRAAWEKLTGRPVVKQGPGKLLTSRRPFKKPHGRPGWRVRMIKVPSAFGLVFNAEYHTTKGFRRWSLEA